MLDLLGFWTAVTVLVSPVLVFGTILLSLGISGVGGWVTRGRCEDLGEKLPVFKQFCKLVDNMPETAVLVLFFGGLLEIICGTMIAADNDITGVHLVATIAEAIAPGFAWVGVVALLVIGARVMSDAYYKIATKLENLESK